MPSTASFKGHPLHPIIIPLPIGLWIFSIVSDLIFKLGYGGPVWNDVAFYTLAGGIVGALIAALPGFIDLTELEKSENKNDRDLAHDDQSARGRSLLREFLAAYAAPARRQPSDCPLSDRNCADHYLGLARRRACLRSRRGCETTTGSKHLSSRR